MDVNAQLLDEIVQFPPSDPYRINVSIVARHIQACVLHQDNDEKQLLRKLRPYHHEATIQDLIQDGREEVVALRARLARTSPE